MFNLSLLKQVVEMYFQNYESVVLLKLFLVWLTNTTSGFAYNILL